jgi:hypothetical protein
MLFAVAGDGTVRPSGDAGRGWRDVGNVGGQPAAFESVSADELYVALHDGTVQTVERRGRLVVGALDPLARGSIEFGLGALQQDRVGRDDDRACRHQQRRPLRAELEAR